VIQPPLASEEEPAGTKDSPAEIPTIERTNSFKALVDASAVRFSHAREVDQISETCLKIRLSRGQKCVLQGACVLWVKQGSVSVYGSVVQASVEVHRIYAPSTHALPSIEALSSKAEFQLDSLDDGIRNLPYIGVKDVWEPVGAESSALTFGILGFSFEQDPKAPNRFRELNIDPWKSVLTDLSRVETATPPRILLCGKRSSGLSTFARCLLNRILAREAVQREVDHRKGVMVLDLDTNLPEFAPPGTVSLVHVTKPVHGPSFTHVVPAAKASSNRILKSHFLGDLVETELMAWHTDRISDLLDTERKFQVEGRDAPVIVLAPKWLNGLDGPIATNIWKKLSLTDVVCLDSHPASPHLQPWRALAATGACRIHQLPAQSFDKIAPAREHDLQMQSYFHAFGSLPDWPIWIDTPILAATHGNIVLTYGNDHADVSTIILEGGNVALADTYDALEGSIVAVVAVRHETNGTLTLGEDNMGALDDNSEQASDNSKHNGATLTDEGLPRWMQDGFRRSVPVPADRSHCIGLALVTGIDVPNRQIVLTTPMELDDFRAAAHACQVALVVHKATADGRFRADWTRKEMRSGARARSDAKVTVSDA
jgi:polynucleotide 5'-hydroxyl-kinase GRC3/NOL9